jgi:hypothetical protein
MLVFFPCINGGLHDMALRAKRRAARVLFRCKDDGDHAYDQYSEHSGNNRKPFLHDIEPILNFLNHSRVLHHLPSAVCCSVPWG